MATSTTNYSFTLPEVGGDTDAWGSQLNANWSSLDSTLKTIADSVGDDVTLTGNDYLTISSQVITVGDVDLTTDVTGTLPVGSGGTGLSSLGTANQVLAVNATADGLEFQTVSGSGTVTSVSVTGSDGIEVDSGSPITTSGTIVLGVNATALSTHLGLGSLATQSSITESQISDLQTYLTASSTATLTNKSGNISQWTNDSGYLTAETNNLSTVSGTLGIANGGTGQTTVATARVALLPTLTGNGSKLVSVNSGATDIEYIATSTLSITESQISDLQTYLTASSTATLTNKSGNISQWTNDSGYLTNESNDLSSAVTWADVPNANITQGAVTQHQAALSITESQISDLGTYQTADAGLTSISGLTTAADKMLYTTAADTYAVTSLSSFARTILDDADANAVIGTLGLSSLYATAAQGTLAGTATQPGDLATTLNVSATDKLLGRATTGAGAVEEITLTSAGRALLDDADAATQRSTLGLVIGTDVQAFDQDLATLAGLSNGDGNFIVGSATGWVVESGATVRTSLGLGSIATQASTAVDIDGGAIDGVTIGTNAVVTDLRVDNLQLDANTISSTDTNGNVAISPNGTGNVVIGNFTFDADQSVGAGQDNYVLTYDNSSGLISLEASAGGGSGSSYIEHSSTVSDSLAISAGTNRMYVGRTDFSSGGVTMAGTLVVTGGFANFTSASALNITGTLHVI